MGFNARKTIVLGLAVTSQRWLHLHHRAPVAQGGTNRSRTSLRFAPPIIEGIMTQHDAQLSGLRAAATLSTGNLSTTFSAS